MQRYQEPLLKMSLCHALLLSWPEEIYLCILFIRRVFVMGVSVDRGHSVTLTVQLARISLSFPLSRKRLQMNAVTKLWNAFLTWKTSFDVFKNAFSFVFFMSIFHWADLFTFDCSTKCSGLMRNNWKKMHQFWSVLSKSPKNLRLWPKPTKTNTFFWSSFALIQNTWWSNRKWTRLAWSFGRFWCILILQLGLFSRSLYGFGACLTVRNERIRKTRSIIQRGYDRMERNHLRLKRIKMNYMQGSVIFRFA